jgi:hypothetical protein
LRTRVAATYPLEDASRALEAIRAGGLGGRVVLTV